MVFELFFNCVIVQPENFQAKIFSQVFPGMLFARCVDGRGDFREIKGATVSANMLCCCCCAAILVYFSVRDWTRICYVIGLENIWIHPL